jgi:hypothetical protein
MADIGGVIEFLAAHNDGPGKAVRSRPFSVIRREGAPVIVSCFQIQAIQNYVQGMVKQLNPDRSRAEHKGMFQEVFSLWDRSFIHLAGPKREGEVCKITTRQLEEMREWVSNRLSSNNQENRVLASQILEGVTHPLRIAKGFSLKDGLDLAESFCLLGYLSHAPNWTRMHDLGKRWRKATQSMCGSQSFLMDGCYECDSVRRPEDIPCK